MSELSNVTPILRIFDEAKAREFYVGFLGFKIEFEHRFGDNFPIYLGLCRDTCVLHLSEHHGDGSPGTVVRIETKDVAGFVQELAAKDYKFAKPGEPATMPWGSLEITITDPFCNKLVFHQNVGP